jgi:hypothetical protein
MCDLHQRARRPHDRITSLAVAPSLLLRPEPSGWMRGGRCTHHLELRRALAGEGSMCDLHQCARRPHDRVTSLAVAPSLLLRPEPSGWMRGGRCTHHLELRRALAGEGSMCDLHQRARRPHDKITSLAVAPSLLLRPEPSGWMRGGRCTHDLDLKCRSETAIAHPRARSASCLLCLFTCMV